MAKKLIFAPTQTTTAKNQFIESMQDMTFKMSKSSDTFDIDMTAAENAIRQSLINALHLQPGGNVLFPERGAPLINMLFNTKATVEEQRTALLSFITVNEPRIKVVDLSLTFNTNEYNERIANIGLQYSFMSSSQIYNVTVDLINSGK